MKGIDNLSNNFELACKGKVRDVYSHGSDKLLIYTSDRISAFDFTFEDQIAEQMPRDNQRDNIYEGLSRDLYYLMIRY